MKNANNTKNTKEPDRFDLIFSLRLSPGAAENAVQGWALDAGGDKILKAAVTAAPEKGKANKAFIDMLSSRLNISKSQISIISGQTSRRKTVKIAHATQADKKALLAL